MKRPGFHVRRAAATSIATTRGAAERKITAARQVKKRPSPHSGMGLKQALMNKLAANGPG